jgi:hypothetical protein
MRPVKTVNDLIDILLPRRWRNTMEIPGQKAFEIGGHQMFFGVPLSGLYWRS